MLANFAYFFGGPARATQPMGPIGVLMVAILAPITAMLVQIAVSRTREYDADREGAEICGRPLWLASALAKIERGARAIDNPRAEANPATAHLFIVNPLARAWHRQPVRDPSLDRQPHPAAAGDGAGSTAPSRARGAYRRGPWG